MFTIEIKGLNELQKAFAQSPRIVGPELERATRDAGLHIQKVEIKEAPHSTGALQRSIRFKYIPIVSEIYPTVNYAKYVHEGTRPHAIYPKRARALRFKTKGGKIVYARRVAHPGTKANPFVERTVDRSESKVQQMFKDATENIIKKLING